MGTRGTRCSSAGPSANPSSDVLATCSSCSSYSHLCNWNLWNSSSNLRNWNLWILSSDLWIHALIFHPFYGCFFLSLFKMRANGLIQRLVRHENCRVVDAARHIWVL